jgi:hypothetical protein
MNTRTLLVVSALFSLLFVATAAAQSNVRRILNPAMNIAVSEAPGVMYEGFRGEPVVKGVVHALEDGEYPTSEHSNLYLGDTKGLGESASGTRFAGPPNITWNVKKKNADGTSSLISTLNNNKATNNSLLPDPGLYKVENDGARATSNSSAGADESGADAGASESGPGGTRVITSSNAVTIKSHDVTPPELFVLIQEGVGAIDLAANQAALEAQLDQQLAALGGQLSAETQLKGDLQEASLMGVVEVPRNAAPEKKTVSFVRSGTLFDAAGHKIYEESPGIPTEVDDESRQTRKAVVGSAFIADKGVFVRRNVPFLIVVKQTDNGDADPREISYRIVEKSTGKDVEPTDGANLFRVANYPRSEYRDQPDFELLVQSQDKVGNRTALSLPLYITNTQASFEAGKAE